jgi:hypothetical protein
MNCIEISEQEVLERYLLNQLSDSEQDTFEQHYFECSSCFEQLQIARTIQVNAALEKTNEGANFSPSVLSASRSWIWAVAVAGLILAGAVWGPLRYHGRSNPPRAQVSSIREGHVASSRQRWVELIPHPTLQWFCAAAKIKPASIFTMRCGNT